MQVSSELKALRNGEVLENADDIKEKLRIAKTVMTVLKDAMTEVVAKEDQTKIGQQVAQTGARRFVFDTVLNEIVSIVGNLNEKYDIQDDEGIFIAKILKRKEMKEKYAAEHDRLRTLIDRLLDFTDVLFDGKDLVINAQLRKIKQINEMREEFEDKLRMDLDLYDLTDQKMKLATHTTIDIGKFSGEVGEDFYTFRTQFESAYNNHPRNLKVEWLKNNHLAGKAKNCIGSLDDLERIWARLKDNFGNTEQLLLYHFGKINKLGQLSKQKSFSSKQFYVQNLINAMQDVKTLALAHKLVGELSYGPQLDKIVLLLEDN